MPVTFDAEADRSDLDELSSFQNPEDGCPDWIISTGSNVSIVTNRESFIEYTPFPTEAQPVIGGSFDVHGVGKIAVRVACAAPETENVITLDDVLYSTASSFNVLGNDFLSAYPPQGLSFRPTTPDESYYIKGANGSLAGTLKWHPKPQLLKLCLAPDPRTTRLDTDGYYALGVTWTNAERQKWEDYKYGVTLLSTDEKQWLKDNGYKDEWSFLKMYGLTLLKEEDRQIGRNLLRQMRCKAA